MRLTTLTSLIVLTFVLSSCGGGGGGGAYSTPAPVSNPNPSTPTPAPTPTSEPTIGGLKATDWTIGPIVRGDNFSEGTPLHPEATPEALVFDIPMSPGHIHYVTRFGNLSGASAIRMRFRIETDEGAIIVPKFTVGMPALLTLYFQRAGDDWSGTGKYETYRWWASFATLMPLVEGEYEITAPLDGRWTAVGSSSNVNNASAFQAAVTNSNTVGFTFGGNTGLGHGVQSTFNKARLVLLEFEIEG